MIEFSDYELEKLLEDDLPYLDLTTYLQDINNKKAKLEIYTREDIIVSCSEEAARIVKLKDCVVEHFVPSKTALKKGDIVLSFSGDYNTIHKVWRTTQLLLEYSCKIATYTANMKEKIKEEGLSCEILTTRKTYPFAKKFCIKSTLVGGAYPHRINLSETILLFPHHRAIYKDLLEFYAQIAIFKQKMPEKKIVVETSSFEDAQNVFAYGADVLQLDKMSIEDIEKVVKLRDEKYKNINLIAAGGINLENIKQFAKTKVDAVVTSSMYLKGMADLGSRLTVLD